MIPRHTFAHTFAIPSSPFGEGPVGALLLGCIYYADAMANSLNLRSQESIDLLLLKLLMNGCGSFCYSETFSRLCPSRKSNRIHPSRGVLRVHHPTCVPQENWDTSSSNRLYPQLRPYMENHIQRRLRSVAATRCSLRLLPPEGRSAATVSLWATQASQDL